MKCMQANKLNSSFSRSKVCALLFVPLLSMQTFSTQAFSANKAAERWYEIEVILFSQLGDKKLNNESFPDQERQPTALPKYRRIVDLLTPHIYPDTSSLRLQLPKCGDYTKAKTLVELASIAPPFFAEKSLIQINQSVFEDDLAEGLLGQEDLSTNSSFEESTAQEITTEQDTFNYDDLLSSEEDGISTTATFDLASEEFITAITPEERELINQAELEFSSYPFQYSQHLPIDQICALPTVYDNKFSINLNGSVDGNEDLFSDKPYLISKDSLQMSDIVTKLKLSKNFRPLLHLGWRQAPKDRNKASAFRIFSGENLAFDYKKDQINYQALVQQALMKQAEYDNANAVQATATLDDMSFNETTQPITPEQILQQRINEVLASVNDISAVDESKIVAQINDESLAIDISSAQSATHLLQPIEPVKPLQPWTLDGLLRIHLNRYLYITADFNLLTSTAVDQKSPEAINDTPEFKSIRFNQNRRVISGEIHYFDHPYMGMVVQIRKYKRPEPEIELTQADSATVNN